MLSFLSRRECLAIFDNCEHLLDDCAEIAGRVLERCTDVSLLATSREALRVEGEQIWQIPSLSSSEAAVLLIARAQAVSPDFELTSQNAPAIAEICRRLDGIPLAIEFAAARVTHLSPQQIADRLGDRFRLLTGGRGRVQRQRTLKAVLDWSYDLLTDAERCLLGRLSVFAGTFGITNVEGICSGGAVDGADIVDLLGSLVAKSLLEVENKQETTRYRLLDSVRAYASEKLHDVREADGVRARHRDWYLSWAEATPWEWVLGAEAMTGAQPIPVEEQANVRAALEWSEAEGRLDLVVRLAARLFGLWFWGGYRGEGYRWVTTALPEDLDLTIEDRVGALCVTANLALVNEPAMADSFADRAVRAAEGRPSAPHARALALRAESRAIASVSTRNADVAAAAGTDIDEALAMTDRLELSDAFKGSILVSRGHSELTMGDARAALDAHEAGFALLPPDPISQMYIAADAHLVGDHKHASRAARALIEWDLPQGSAGRLARWSRSMLVPPAVALAGAGHFVEAVHLLTEHREEVERSGGRGSIEATLIGFACVAYLSGDPTRSSRLLAWIRSRIDAGRPIPSQAAFALYRHYVRLVRDALGPDEARRCRDEGQAMSESEAVACAMQVGRALVVVE